MSLNNTVIDILEAIVKKTSKIKNPTSICPYNNHLEFPTKLNAKKVPSVSIKDYIDRLAKYLNCENPIFIIALLYIDRIVCGNPGFFVTSLNVHRYSSMTAIDYTLLVLWVLINSLVMSS